MKGSEEKWVILEFRCLNSVHNFSGLILHTFIGNTNNYSFQEKIRVRVRVRVSLG